MGFMKGQSLVAKAAAVAMYGVLPATMIAALIYSPPNSNNDRSKKPSPSTSSSS